jgi:hypothetical protein
MREPRIIEGVPYRPYRVYYTLANGKRRRMVRWSPGLHVIVHDAARELTERFGLEGTKPWFSVYPLT